MSSLTLMFGASLLSSPVNRSTYASVINIPASLLASEVILFVVVNDKASSKSFFLFRSLIVLAIVVNEPISIYSIVNDYTHAAMLHVVRPSVHSLGQ